VDGDVYNMYNVQCTVLSLCNVLISLAPDSGSHAGCLSDRGDGSTKGWYVRQCVHHNCGTCCIFMVWRVMFVQWISLWRVSMPGVDDDSSAG
jgi:hypothetical protein